MQPGETERPGSPLYGKSVIWRIWTRAWSW